MPGFAFQGVVAPTDEQIEAMSKNVEGFMETRALSGEHAWRTDARNGMKMLLAQERFEEAHLVLGMLYEKEVFDNVCMNMMMSSYKKRNCLSQVLFLFSQMREKGIQPDIVSFNIIVDSCGKAKQMGLACDYLDQMRKAGKAPTVNTYTSLIDACGKNGDLERADFFLHQMVSQGVQPNTCTFTSLIQACCRRLEFDRALSLLRTLVSSEWYIAQCMAANIETLGDKTPYTTLVRASLDADNINTAFGALSLMASNTFAHQLRPDYTLILNALEMSHRHERIDLIFEAFLLHTKWSFTPHPCHLKKFLVLCGLRAGAGGLPYAHKLLEVARVHRWPTSDWVMESVFALFEQAVQAHEVNLTLLILELGLQSPADLTLTGSTPRLRVTEWHAVQLVSTCLELGINECAFHILGNLQALKVPLTTAIFEVLLIGACNNRCVVLMEQLDMYGVMNRMNDYALGALLELCGNRLDFYAAGRMIAYLKQHQTRPNHAAAHSLLSASMAAGQKDTFAWLLNQLNSMGVVFGQGVAFGRRLSEPESRRQRKPKSSPLTQPHEPASCPAGKVADASDSLSPISVTTPPSASWECCAPGSAAGEFDDGGDHATGVALYALPTAELVAANAVLNDFRVYARNLCTPRKATAADEVAELGVALARMASEESNDESNDEPTWWSEA